MKVLVIILTLFFLLSCTKTEVSIPDGNSPVKVVWEVANGSFRFYLIEYGEKQYLICGEISHGNMIVLDRSLNK